MTLSRDALLLQTSDLLLKRQFLKVAHTEMRGETLRRSAVRLAVQGRTTVLEAMRVSNQIDD